MHLIYCHPGCLGAFLKKLAFLILLFTVLIIPFLNATVQEQSFYLPSSNLAVSGADAAANVGKSLPASFSRALTTEDLGVVGTLKRLEGTFSLENKVATMRVDMIEGAIKNPFELITNMSNTARAAGAETLRIQALLANSRLDALLRSRYGLETIDGLDQIIINLK